MNFDKLHSMIPYAKGGKEKILHMYPYNGITLRLPGRHANDTVPKGGDFVVCVDDENMDWTEHQFTHTDLFSDIEKRSGSGMVLMSHYLAVVKGADPEKIDLDKEPLTGEGVPQFPWCIDPQTFLYAVQCLAVAEHRRYAQYEAKFGGRFLPFRFAAGIAEGLWTSADAADKQKRGRPGVEWLEKDHGLPSLTKELMNV